LEKVKIFNSQEVDFLLRLTFDLTDQDFEYLVAILLERDGFEVKNNGGWYDKGVDIVARKDGRTYHVQCKQWAKSYINRKDVGAFYGSVSEHIQKNPDAIFAYVTTSYVLPDAEKFLIDHGVHGIISNAKLLQECRKQGFFSENGWEKLIGEIRTRRMKQIFHSSQKRILTGYDEVKVELRRRRLRELKNHLPLHLRFKPSVINPVAHQAFLQRFFLYWDLL